MRRYLLAGGGVVAVMLAIALLVQRCSSDTAPEAAPKATVDVPAAAPSAMPVPARSLSTEKVVAHVQERARRVDSGAPPGLSPADAALFESARNFERDLWPKADGRTGPVLMFDAEGFATLLDALDAQMAHDAGARELGELFTQGARGKLPMDGSVRLERLACGMRLCAAHFEATGRDGNLPRLGYNSVGGGLPREDGGMSHRVIFSLDPELHLSPRPPARRGG